MGLREFLAVQFFQTTFHNHIKGGNIVSLLEFIYHNPVRCKMSVDDAKSGIRKELMMVIQSDPFLSGMLSTNPDEFVSQLSHILNNIKKNGALTSFVFNEGSGVHSVLDYFSTEFGIVQAKTVGNVTMNEQTPAPIVVTSPCAKYKDKVDLLSIITADTKLETTHVVVGNPNTVIIPYTDLEDITQSDIRKIQLCFHSNKGRYSVIKCNINSALLDHNQVVIEMDELNKLIPSSDEYKYRLENLLKDKQFLDIRMQDLKQTLLENRNKINL